MRGRQGPERIETETLVVDQASSDGSAAAVRAAFPWAEVIELPANVGFAAGNNVGLRRAKGRHVVLLNNDTVVLPDGLERLVRYLDAHPEVGVVGPQLLNPDGTKQNSIHSTPNFVTELVPKGLLESIAPWRYPSKRFEHPGPLAVEAVLGACLMVRREVLEDVGPMPEEYFFFLEETDWCLRIRRAGWKVVHVPAARIVHVHGATLQEARGGGDADRVPPLALPLLPHPPGRAGVPRAAGAAHRQGLPVRGDRLAAGARLGAFPGPLAPEPARARLAPARAPRPRGAGVRRASERRAR